MYMSRSMCTNICVAVDVFQVYFYFSSLEDLIELSLSLRSSMYRNSHEGGHRYLYRIRVVQQQPKNENERIKVRTFERVALLAGADLFSGGKYHRSFAGATRAGAGALPCFNLTRTKQGLISACDGGKMHV